MEWFKNILKPRPKQTGNLPREMGSTKAEEHYVYKPLSYDTPNRLEIRLLKFLEGESRSPISCELFKVSLDINRLPPKPDYLLEDEHSFNDNEIDYESNKKDVNDNDGDNIKYTALSYVWGDATSCRLIQVNGKGLLVPQNLWSFLKRQRETFLKPSKGYKDSLFWVDAICIDQSNIKERSMQVEFMAEIYKRAHRVLVWWGEETPSMMKAFGFFNKWDRLSPLNDQDRTVIKQAFQDEWFDRLWVIQEVAHAQRIVVRCGPMEIPWDKLQMDQEESAKNFTDLKLLRWDVLNRVHGLISQPTMVNDIYLLRRYRYRKCSDPKDRIYALRSLSPALRALSPDYSLSATDVLLQAARAFISWHKSLNILKQETYNTRPKMLRSEPTTAPSWMPDWEQQKLVRIDIEQSACRGIAMPETILDNENPAVLDIQGILSDTINFSTKPFQNVIAVSAPAQQAKLFQDWLPGCNINLGQHPQLKKININDVVQDFLRRKQTRILDSEARLKPLRSRWEPYEMIGISLFTTASGFVGSIPAASKANDVVFIAYGCDQPLVLRPQDTAKSSYSLVGAANIPGLDNGEAVDMRDNGELKECTIHLI